MRTRLIILSLFLVSTLETQIFSQEEIQVVSLNIRYGTPGDGENKWKSRRDRVFTVFDRYKDGIIATQEGDPLQFDEILKKVKDLGVVYRSRTLEDKEGPAHAVFYNKKMWSVEEHNTFWLSDTPDKPATKSWGNTLPRIATLVIFKNKKTGKKLRLLNTLLDHRSQNSRIRSTELILRTLMTESEQMPTLLIGGFNVTKEDDVITRVKEFFSDTYSGNELEGCTYHGYNGGSHCPRIDYIFYDGESGLKLKNFEIDRWKSKQYFYPSDHYPLVSKFSW